MRHSVLLLFLVACSSRERSPQTMQEAVSFAPADALGVVHLDLQAGLYRIQGTPIEKMIDTLAESAPGCDRALIKTVETVTVAFRSLDATDLMVLRLGGPIERAPLQKCLESLSTLGRGTPLTVTSKDKDLVITSPTGNEFMVVRWQDGGVLIGSRADLSRTAGPEKPGLKAAIALVPKPNIDSWLVMDRIERLPGPVMVQSLSGDGMHLRLGVRHDDTTKDVAVETRRLVDDAVSRFLKQAAEKGVAVDEASMLARVQISVSDRWGLIEANWSKAEFEDLKRQIAEVKAPPP